MKISIIIPVYNVELYLSRCIESILQQSYLNFELILINDGSTDSSGSICDLYRNKDTRIIVFHNTNMGVSCSRNIGIELASGDFIMFVDSDDFIEPDTLKLFTDNNRNSEHKLLIFNYFRYYDNGIKIPNEDFDTQVIDIEKDFSVQEKYKYFFGRSYGTQIWNKLYPAKIIKDNRLFFNEKLSVGEDFLFNFRVLKYIDKIVKCNYYTYNYFIRSGSITHSYKKNLYEQNEIILSDLNKFSYADNGKDCDTISFFAYTSLDNMILNLYRNNLSYENLHAIILKSSSNKDYVQALERLISNKYYKNAYDFKQSLFMFLVGKAYTHKFYKLVTFLMILRQKIRAYR